jgi:dihydrofolate reductase
MPRVLLIVAETLNGKIAHGNDEPVRWTSKEDKELFIEVTKACGVVVMGRRTYETIGKPLPGRLNIVLTRDPGVKEDMPGALEFVNQDPSELLALLGARGYERVAVIGGASVYSLFLAAGLVDEILVTIEPLLFGRGIDMIQASDRDTRLELLECRKLNAHAVFLRYKVKKI